MTTAQEMQTKIDKLEINMRRLDSIVNGSDTAVISIDTGTVPSISKLMSSFQNDINEAIAEEIATATTAVNTLTEEVNNLSEEVENTITEQTTIFNTAVNTLTEEVNTLDQEIATIITEQTDLISTAVDNLEGIVNTAINTYAWYNNRGAWQATTAYNPNDIFVSSGVHYLVVIGFTSTSNVATDIANGKVIVHQPKDWVQTVGSFALLRFFEPAYSNQIVNVLGHTIAGLGGGMFRYDASDTTTADDNGTVIVTAGGKRWKRIINGYVLPQFWGALGDNSTNDTDAFNKAIASLNKVFVPKGTYLVNNVVLKSGSHLEGYAGRSYDTTESSQVVFKPYDSNCVTILDPSGCRGFIVKNLSLNGVNRVTDGIVPQTADCSHACIENVSIRFCDIGLGGSGAYYFRSSEISKSIIGNNNSGLINTIDTNIESNIVNANLGNGIAMATGCNDNRVVNNKIEWNRGYNVSLFECANIIIDNNIIDRAFKAGLKINGCLNVSGSNLFRRNGRNNTLLERSHILIEGTNTNINLSHSDTKTGADDGGSGTITPAYTVEFNLATGTSLIIANSNLLGYVTNITAGSLPNSLIMVDNLGSENIVQGQLINQKNGRTFFTSQFFNINESSNAVVNVKNKGIDNFKNAFRNLKVWVRNASTGNDFYASFDALLLREGGSASLSVSLPTSQIGTSGAISTLGTGTVADLSFGNFSADGSTFDITVTNKLTGTIGVELDFSC